ncbi:MAG: methyltransferase domain-containing protein [Patescibacteria group bacterium]
MAEFLQPEKVIQYLHARDGMRIADFGAGQGFFAILLAKIVGSSGKLTALDVQKESVEFVRRRAQLENFTNIEAVWANLELPRGSKLPDNSQDAVIISNILFQADDKKALLVEAFRVLRIDGTLLLLEWNEDAPPPGPPRELRVPQQTTKELCQEVGLSFAEKLPAGNHHYGFLFKKLVT